MSIKCFLYISAFLQCLSCTNIFILQGNVIKQQQSVTDSLPFSDPILDSIVETNTLIIGYADSSTNIYRPINYYLVGFKADKVTSYVYKKNKVVINDQKSYELSTRPLNNKVGKAILSTFLKNEGWNINYDDTKSPSLFCPNKEVGLRECNISDGKTNLLYVITRGRIKVSKFYEPMYFEQECCPGNSDRKHFLEIIKPIQKAFIPK